MRLRDSINRYDKLIDYAIELGHEVIAFTEHESVSNAVKIQKYYKKIKSDHPDFKVILGNEIYLCRNGLNNENFVSGEDRYWHFILLAKDAIGHQQIREISTRAWKRSYKARGMRRVPTYYQDLEEIIGANPGHVIGSSSCLGGYLPFLILKYRDSSSDQLLWLERINQWTNSIEQIFGKGNFFLELQPSESKEQTYVNEFLVSFSSQANIPYIITTD